MRYAFYLLFLTGVAATNLHCLAIATESSSSIAGKIPKQGDLLAITGKIIRADGTAIAGARIRIIYRSGEGLFSRESDSNGEYLAIGLPPGIYDMEVKAAGFKKAKRKSIQVVLGRDHARVNVVMKLSKK